MAIELNDNIDNKSPKILDARYSQNGVTPYVSVSQANSLVSVSYRSIGLTLNIANEEYWYKNGITDVDLIKKESAPPVTVSNSVITNALTTTVSGVNSTPVNIVTGLSIGLAGNSLSITVNGVTSSLLDISSISSTNSWLKAGNSGINPSTQFLGTTDGQPLVFKTNNTEVGRITSTGIVTFDNMTMGYGKARVTTNTVYGFNALNEALTGINQTAVGYNSLKFSTGENNSSLGFSSLSGVIAGNRNTSFGSLSGVEVVSGNDNTFLGYNTGRGIITGTGNTIIGANVTGLSSSLNNTIILATGTAGIMQYIDSNGLVGFGTTTPGYKIDVVSSLNTGIRVATNAAGAYNGPKLLMEVGGGTWDWGFSSSRDSMTALTKGSTTAGFIFGAGTETTPTNKFSWQQGYFSINVPFANVDAYLHVRSFTTGNASDKVFLVQNFAGNDRFNIRNDGSIYTTGIQGVSATVANPTSITVTNGLVTAIS